MYTFLQKEQLLNPNQSGFRPSDSRKPITLNHTWNFPISFLDISKAFDEIWHEGLLYKLNSIGI